MNNTSKEATHHNTSQERIIRQGHGVNFYDNGEIEFEGGWKDNAPFGQGMYIKQINPSLFVGTRRNEKPHGIYVGCFSRGTKFNGQGTLYDGIRKAKIYEGNWKNNKRHGQGTLYNTKGRIVFTGEWKDDKPCIDPSFLDDTAIPPPGNKQTELFKKQGTNTIDLKGRHYTGGVVKYHPSGSKSYEGGLDYGKRHGHGISFDERGVRVYTGEWKDDKRHGQGTSFNHDGTVDFKGLWENDEPIRSTD